MAAMDKAIKKGFIRYVKNITGSNNSRYCDTHYVKKEGTCKFGNKYVKISRRMHKKKTKETCPSNGHKNND